MTKKTKTAVVIVAVAVVLVAVAIVMKRKSDALKSSEGSEYVDEDVIEGRVQIPSKVQEHLRDFEEGGKMSYSGKTYVVVNGDWQVA